jgi:hypothetical protein
MHAVKSIANAPKYNEYDKGMPKKQLEKIEKQLN